MRQEQFIEVTGINNSKMSLNVRCISRVDEPNAANETDKEHYGALIVDTRGMRYRVKEKYSDIMSIIGSYDGVGEIKSCL